MRIIVFSDSHGNYGELHRIIQKHRDDGDIFLHLGDGEREFDRISQDFPMFEMHGVSGNCDWIGMNKTSDLLRVMGHKIFYTHGHIFHVKSGLEELRQTARGFGATIALFGHTHNALAEYVDGLYLLNPGSVTGLRGKASYGTIDITEAGIATNIVRL